jgi:hypothetical protein
MTDWSSDLIKNYGRRREWLFARLGQSAREVVAAWFLLFLVVAGGLSILAIHHRSVADCTMMVATPGTHHRFTADHEWEDPECSIGPCNHSQAAQEIDPDHMQAVQSGGDATPVYSGSSTPVSLDTNSADQDERLC